MTRANSLVGTARVCWPCYRLMLIHEIHVFELQIETKFEVCYPRIFSSNFVSIRKYLTIIGRG